MMRRPAAVQTQTHPPSRGQAARAGRSVDQVHIRIPRLSPGQLRSQVAFRAGRQGHRLSRGAAPRAAASKDEKLPPRPPPRRARPPFSARVVTYIRSAPDRARLYFRRRPLRQWMWRVICFGIGYYSGNVVSLTFGTLGTNDVAAGIVCVGFTEFITYMYYKDPSPSLFMDLLNSFKLGFTASLIADAWKLAG